ncbi:zinc/manganese transport system ATP-binding protein [Desulfovibrio legallii]|uniref:Zinc/manganese transport system ATP-binding protein n=1 Tax=Desulfovibrio legallii TaxID=571438 RepID=A0A1G7KKQ8_9BACT|nr:ABC transporter ATP-binding protein [Desulfovibrio legallii]SDF37389.1 zinc/manganese transport system ATP-binding protein [Desulfovibrio legallii]
MSRQPRPISVCDLSLAYNRHPAVRHLCCHFAPGSLTAVVGPNGAGKSTLLKALAGLLSPREGSVDLGGQRAADIAYLPQQAAIDRSFPITVLDMVSLGHWPRVGAWGALAAAAWREAQAALATLDLTDFGARPISALSVGQFQRVQFARLLLQDAPVILLDEPFTALDARTTDDLLALVRRWHAEGRTVVAVIHDLEQVRIHFPQCLLFARDPIAFGPTERVLTPENLARARELSACWDSPVASVEDAEAGPAGRGAA